MTTVALDRVFDQGAIANSDKSFFDIVLEAVRSETRSFLEKCKLIWEAKQLPLTEWNEIKQLLGWTGHTANPCIKIWQWISDLGINTYNLELLDINTIKALCRDKYLEVWYQLQSKRMVVQDVRSQMADINKAAIVPKEPQKVLYWKQSKWGDEANGVLVVQLQNSETGLEFEKRWKESGKVCVAMFVKELLHKTSLIEQAKAVPDTEDFLLVSEAVPVQALDSISPNDCFIVPKRDKTLLIEIDALVEQYQKIDAAIANFIKLGYEDSSYPMRQARSELQDVVLQLRQRGIEAELRCD